MKKVLILITLLIIVTSCSKPVDYKSLGDRNGLMYNVNSQKPYSGRAVEYYNFYNSVKKKGNFEDGLKDGKWIGYFKNGKIKYEENFKNGIQDGKYILYFKNGQINLKANLKDGEFDGWATWYFENGEIQHVSNYKDGKLLD